MSIYHDLVEAILPSDILLFFDMVDFKKEQDHYRIYLEEKNEVPSEYKKGHVRANWFLPEIKRLPYKGWVYNSSSQTTKMAFGKG